MNIKTLTSIVLIFTISINSPLKMALAAEQISTVKSETHNSYYDYLVAPTSALVMGMQLDGKRGALVGLIVGCIDETLVRFGWSEQHYLTSGLLGSGATASIQWPWARYLGFGGGVLVASGKLNPILDKSGLPISTALVAASQGGLKGGAFGAACGIVDEALISFEVTDRPYLSNLVYGVAATTAVAPHLSTISSKLPFVSAVLPSLSSSSLPLTQAAGVALGAAMSSGSPSSALTSPLQLKDNLYRVLSRIIEPQTFNNLMEKQGIVLVTTQIALANLNLRLTNLFQNMDTSYARLGTATEIVEVGTAHHQFNNALVGLVIFFPLNFAVQTASNYVNSLLSEATSREVQDAMMEQFSFGEVALKLSADHNATILVEKMDANLRSVLAGGGLLGGALQTTVDGVFYVSFLYRTNAMDLLVVLDVYNRIIAVTNAGLAGWIASYEQSLSEASSRENNLIRDILREPTLLIPGDKMELVKAKMYDARREQRLTYDKMQALSSVQNGYQIVSHILNYMAKFYLIGIKLVNQQMSYANSQPALQAVSTISQAMSWQSNNAQSIERINFSIGNLDKLLDKFEEKKPADLVANYSVGAADEIGIRLDNLSVGVEDTLLVHVPELFLKRGVYAVTGAQGSGKSALLSKVKGVQDNQFWAKGNITYLTKDGLLPKRVLVTQKDYLTPYSTLLEVIMSKPMSEIDVATAKPRALELLTEIGFDTTGDNEKVDKWLTERQNDWTKLSGGQRKTVAIVGAIMAKPDIVILDEVFAGMDKRALANAQRAIRRELSDSMVFVVDHHAVDNNLDAFYDKELNCVDKQVYLK